MGFNVKCVVTIFCTCTHINVYTFAHLGKVHFCQIYVDVLCGVRCTANPHILYLAATVQV